MTVDLDLGPAAADLGPSMLVDPPPATTVWVRTTSGLIETTMPRPIASKHVAGGLITTATLAANQQVAPGAGVDLTGVTLIWIADPTRRYEIVLEIGAAEQTGKEGIQIVAIADEKNATRRAQSSQQLPGGRGCYRLSELVGGLQGPVTRKARFSTSLGGTTVYAGVYAARLALYDVGAQS